MIFTLETDYRGILVAMDFNFSQSITRLPAQFCLRKWEFGS